MTVRTIGIAKSLAHLEMIVVRCLNQLDGLAGRFHLSFPKIISGSVDDAVRPRWEWRQ